MLKMSMRRHQRGSSARGIRGRESIASTFISGCSATSIRLQSTSWSWTAKEPSPHCDMSTVILGAGIIGTSTAYYLSKSTNTPASAVHLVDPSPRLFASASGSAAGFLAKDWFSSSVAPLGALSFDLHKQLAEEHNGRDTWGYSRSTGTSLADTGGKRGDDWLRDGNSRAEAAGQHEFVSGDGPAWLTGRGTGRVEVISEGDSTAQVCVLRHRLIGPRIRG